MITFGITGGIASGKSTVTKTFIKLGVPIVDADVVARQVVEPGTVGLEAIVDAFGQDILCIDGTLNRPKLGDLVFHDATQMSMINHIMTPLINTESSRQIAEMHAQGHEIVGYDAALICEMGNADKYRPLIVVQCPQAIQVERLMKRNDLTYDQAMARITCQMPVEQKAKLADWIIDTSGTIEDSTKQTETTFLCLRIRLRDQIMHARDRR